MPASVQYGIRKHRRELKDERERGRVHERSRRAARVERCERGEGWVSEVVQVCQSSSVGFYKVLIALSI